MSIASLAIKKKIIDLIIDFSPNHSTKGKKFKWIHKEFIDFSMSFDSSLRNF